jgi:SAM-dependent methyltransferase
MTHGHHHHHAEGPAEFAALADYLDLDAEVFHGYLSAAITQVHELAGGAPAGRILDLGCGTGTGSLALARRFDGAEVIAVDQSAELLARLQAKAHDLGLGGRIHTIEADLDGPWPAVGPVDLVWTSKTLHHLADPARALAEIFTGLRPGGLLAVAEMTNSPLGFLPDDVGLGRLGLEARYQAALAKLNAAELPYLGADWGLLMSQAGFTGVAEHVFGIDLPAPLPGPARRYVQVALQRGRDALDDELADDDLAALDALTGDDGPHSVLQREDLAIRGTRAIWTATRP